MIFKDAWTLVAKAVLVAMGSNAAAWMGNVEGWNFGSMAGGTKLPAWKLETKIF